VSHVPVDVRNPRTGEIDYSFTPPGDEGLRSRCAELRAAQSTWDQAGLEARIWVMNRWADVIDEHRDEIVHALMEDTGRFHIAQGEVIAAARNIRRWGERAPGLIDNEVRRSEVMPTLKFRNQYVPYTLVGCISPWNFPVALSLIDAVPALVAGCAVIIKPSEVTPRFVEPLKETLSQVPELADVLEILPGAGDTGAALVANADAVCFTGSVATGRKVGVAAAEHFIPAFLELGGKDPAVVLPGADLDQATDAILRGSALASGQVCLAIERVYVHDSIHDECVDMLVDKSKQLELNYPDIMHGQLGPIIFDRQADIIDAHLDDAVAKGAAIRCGGKTETLGGGRYCRATVVTGVNHGMELMTEETFGPVMPVMRYASVGEAVALANDTIFGLSGAVFGESIEAAAAVAERINAGGMSVNDAALTRETYEAEKNAFGFSGIGGSRMGDAGLLRFYRKKALLMQTGKPAGMT
jgi:acyl-CoA reductase-like NAD-dependent aldehyde dehydrogenase